MSKWVNTENGGHTEFGFFEKYFTFNNKKEKQLFFKFLVGLISGISVIIVTLISAFKEYYCWFILFGCIAVVFVVLFYIFFYKDKKTGLAVGFLNF